MKAFVINLKRSPHRLENILTQLKKLGIEFEVTAATDGKLLTEEEIGKLYDSTTSLKYIKTPLTRGEVACSDSHLKTYATIVSQNLPYALVLEDDVELDTQILSVLDEDFLSKSNFDWLQIDYGVTGPLYIQGWLKASWIEIQKNTWFIFYASLKFPFIVTIGIFEYIREIFTRKSPRIVKFARPLYLASAYIITQEGAKKLISFGRPIKFAADMLPNKARVLKNFSMKGISPSLAHQDKKFDSDIGLR